MLKRSTYPQGGRDLATVRLSIIGVVGSRGRRILTRVSQLDPALDVRFVASRRAETSLLEVLLVLFVLFVLVQLVEVGRGELAVEVGVALTSTAVAQQAG